MARMMDSIDNRQIPLALSLADDTTFENYFSSNSNTVDIVNYLQTLVEKDKLEGSVYLWGETGVGKSHLLQASCHSANQQRKTSFYVPLKSYLDLQPAIFQGLETLDVIAIDDVNGIASMESWEEALFDLYNRCYETNTLLLFADRKPARETAIKLADLASRLTAALALELHALADHDKMLAIVCRAKARGLQLSVEVAQFLLHRCARSMSELISILDTLDQLSLSAKRKLTIPFVKKVLNI